MVNLLTSGPMTVKDRLDEQRVTQFGNIVDFLTNGKIPLGCDQ